MRTLPFYLLIVLSVIFLSCSKEDENLIDTTLLIGDWNVTAVKYTGTSTTSALGVKYTTKFTGTGMDMDFMVSFNENPNSFVSSGTYSVELVAEAMGDTYTQIVQVPNFTIPGSWNIVNGNKLRIESAGEVQESIINKLTTSQMIMTNHDKRTTTQNGMEVISDISIVFTFEKD